MTKPIDILAVLPLRAGYENDIFAAAMRCALESRKEAGCLMYQPYRSQGDHPKLVFIERWHDESAIAFHENTPHFKAFIAFTEGKLANPPEILRLDEIA
ncbi:putative quinol monooxygenase [Acidisoma silvae]|uniref:Antibiotic biosynthesis monooxygenase n=1 Tax=Acidisoma silvae TaxID=2802396 RepID=A0A963YU63_9PROT|nr:putative quinol monooxygenase [Acidisoma silvae]MCB8877132.1 antibiotic biosynthesis monooxygenase [Acidisoma silvae]